MKTMVEMVREKLIEMGADGLYNHSTGCGCDLSRLMICMYNTSDCIAAKNNPEKAIKMECPFWMEPMK